MLSEQLEKINQYGLDVFHVVQTAARLDAINGDGIIASKLQLVLDTCAQENPGRITVPEKPETEVRAGLEHRLEQEDTPEQVPEETPELISIDPLKAVELAGKMDFPLSPREWDLRRGIYERALNIELPDSGQIILQFKVWERFWESAGFDMPQHTPRDIIDLTVEQQRTGFLTRQQFDSDFPDSPSSSYVLEEFGGSWKTYAERVETMRRKQALPNAMIKDLLEKGSSVKSTMKAVVESFKDNTGTDELYRARSNRLYQHISHKKHVLDQERVQRTPTRGDISHRYNSLETIANTQIQEFRIYNGKQKAVKREQIAEDIHDHLVPATGVTRKLAYLGLEGPNFKSYILLQQLLDNIFDPGKSVVPERDRSAADAMKAIVRNHDAIEGGEIFDGLNVQEAYVHNALRHHKKKVFDVIFLDYMGGWSMSKERDLETLFSQDQVADQALLYITLLNSTIEKHRVKNGSMTSAIARKGFGTDNQQALLENKLAELCDRNGYEFITVHDEEYFDTQKMLFFGFYLEKKKPAVSEQPGRQDYKKVGDQYGKEKTS